jgi:hypothetical protein
VYGNSQMESAKVDSAAVKVEVDSAAAKVVVEME